MPLIDKYKKVNQELIKILKDLLATGNWEASLFLRTAYKKLQDLSEEASTLSDHLEKTNKLSSSNEHAARTEEGYIKVYVSIYQSDPYSLMKWENTLKSIKEHSISRAIYRSEEYILEAIRSKHGAANEAYAVLYIKESDIISPYTGKIIQDRHGHELLTLRDGCLLPNNIVEFVHLGKRYEFKEGKLLFKSNY